MPGAQTAAANPIIWTSASTTNTVSSVTWAAWSGSYIATGSSSSITITSDAIWTSWNVLTTGSSTLSVIQSYPSQLRQESDIEKAQRIARDKLYAEERAKEEVARKRATLRARKLLVDHLSPAQREDYEKKGHFFLYTNKGRKYRIDQGTHGNVKLIDVTSGDVLGRYCSQPSGVPTEDSMLAQKLYLEIDEDEFVRQANYTPERRAA
jgi:hypothetical protein